MAWWWPSWRGHPQRARHPLLHRCGFTVYGVDPQTILHDGVYYDELLMSRAV
jgi:RimJ/RimL family protein N-acetyltransferase